MNKHIFTEKERALIIQWIEGTIKREDSPHLHVTLNRIRKNEKQFMYEIKFLALTIRRLHHQRLRSRDDDLATVLTLLPITITARNKFAYVFYMLKIMNAQELANDTTQATDARLEAALEAVRLSIEMTKPFQPLEEESCN
jgi:hypothetical protein